MTSRRSNVACAYDAQDPTRSSGAGTAPAKKKAATKPSAKVPAKKNAAAKRAPRKEPAKKKAVTDKAAATRTAGEAHHRHTVRTQDGRPARRGERREETDDQTSPLNGAATPRRRTRAARTRAQPDASRRGDRRRSGVGERHPDDDRRTPSWRRRTDRRHRNVRRRHVRLARRNQTRGQRSPHSPSTVDGARAVDVGASTGGFTDCLLRNGAAHVVAIDVGRGQLAWTLRTDPRVTVMERTNVRELGAGAIDPPADVCVADLSFISLRTVAPNLLALAAAQAEFVLLVKPQYEAGRNTCRQGWHCPRPARACRGPARRRRHVRGRPVWAHTRSSPHRFAARTATSSSSSTPAPGPMRLDPNDIEHVVAAAHETAA